jgi:hypothetical protein
LIRQNGDHVCSVDGDRRVAEDKMVVASCEACFISLMVSASGAGRGTCQGCVHNKGWQATKATARQPAL